MSLFKTAAAKDKVAKCKITDPYQIFFINLYEKTIQDWNKIKSGGDLNKEIQYVLLPQLKSKIDPHSADNNYIKDYDAEAEFAGHIDEAQVQQAYRIYQQNPERYKKQMIETVNESKQKAFFIWWNYFTEPHSYADATRDLYQSNPAFIYCILNRMLNSSGPDDKHDITPLNLLVVSDLYKMIATRGGQAFNVCRNYDEIYGKRMEDGAADDGFGNKWLRIPSKIHDPENYQVNKDKLVGLSLPNDWCTGTYMTDTYLSKGDFWMLMKKGRAVTAIRLEGESFAVEIRGYKNRLPETHWEPILRLMKKEKFDTKNPNPRGYPPSTINYKELKEVELNSVMFSQDNPEARKEYVDDIKNGDTGKYNRLTKEQRAFPDVRVAAIECWKNIIETDTSRFNGCPEELKNEPVIQSAPINYWLKKVEKDPNEYENVPVELKNLPVFRDGYKKFWIGYVKEHPWKHSFSPVEFRDSEEMLDAVREGWINGVVRGLFAYDDIPDDYKGIERIQKARFKQWVKLLSENPYAYEDCPEEYKNLPAILNAGDMGWAKELVDSPDPTLTYDKCKMPFRTRPMVLKARLYAWIRLLRTNPGYIRVCPPDLKNLPEIRDAAGLSNESPKIEQEVNPKEVTTPKKEALNVPKKQKAKKEAGRLNSSFFNNNYIGKLGI